MQPSLFFSYLLLLTFTNLLNSMSCATLIHAFLHLPRGRLPVTLMSFTHLTRFFQLFSKYDPSISAYPFLEQATQVSFLRLWIFWLWGAIQIILLTYSNISQLITRLPFSQWYLTLPSHHTHFCRVQLILLFCIRLLKFHSLGHATCHVCYIYLSFQLWRHVLPYQYTTHFADFVPCTPHSSNFPDVLRKMW